METKRSFYLASNLKFLRKRAGRTQDESAFSLGMKRSTLSGYENAVSEPGMDILVSLAAYYKIAVDTLITVDLSALTESQLYQLENGSDVYIRGSQLRVLATTVNQENNENIELVPLKAKAGYKNGFADPEYIKDLPLFHLPFLSKEKKYRTFQLNGDSMLPIPDGAWVTGEYLQDWTGMLSGQAYIILTLDEGIVFKIAENRIKEEHKLGLYSLNPVYEPYDVEVGQVKEVWKFVHYISNELPDPVLPEDHLLNMVISLKKDLNRISKQIE